MVRSTPGRNDAGGQIINRLIFALLLLVLPLSATTYYVSNTGNDANNGTSTATPWQTLSKIQSFQASFVAGDSVLLQRGGTWNEMLAISNMNGNSSSPITIGNYGSGNLPIIDGGYTSSAHPRDFCISALSGTWSYIVIDGIECRNAYRRAITFQTYSATGSHITVQNSYIHNTGYQACQTCTGPPAELASLSTYDNQLDSERVDFTSFINNVVNRCGGHNCIQVHYDHGGSLVSGNKIGTTLAGVNATDDFCVHNCLDVKGGGGGGALGTGNQVKNNYVYCPHCTSAAAYYYENPFDTSGSITWIGNVSNQVFNGFQSGGGPTASGCTNSTCDNTAKMYNNTVYGSGSSAVVSGWCDSTNGPHNIWNIQKNILDGGSIQLGGSCVVTWDYNDDGGVNAITGNPVGAHDLNRINPQYVSVSAGNFLPQNSTILTAGSSDLVTAFAYLGAVGPATPAPSSTISYVQSKNITQTSANPPLTFNANTGLNNSVFVSIGLMSGTATVTSVTDSQGLTYSLAAGPVVNSGMTTYMYFANITAVAAETVTVHLSASVVSHVNIAEYSSSGSSFAKDQMVTATGTSTTPTTAAVTTGVANELLLAYVDTATAPLAPIAFVRQATAAHASGTSLAVTITAPAAGDALMLTYSGVSSGIASVAGGGVTWNKAVGSCVQECTEIWYGFNSSGSGTTVTVTTTSSSASGANVAEFSGVGTTVGVFGTSSNGTSASPTTSSIVPGDDGELVISAIGVKGGTTTAGPTNGFTTLTQVANTDRLLPAYQIQTGAASASTGWTLSGSFGYDGNIVSFNRANTSAGPQAGTNFVARERGYTLPYIMEDDIELATLTRAATATYTASVPWAIMLATFYAVPNAPPPPPPAPAPTPAPPGPTNVPSVPSPCP